MGYFPKKYQYQAKVDPIQQTIAVTVPTTTGGYTQNLLRFKKPRLFATLIAAGLFTCPFTPPSSPTQHAQAGGKSPVSLSLGRPSLHTSRQPQACSWSTFTPPVSSQVAQAGGSSKVSISLKRPSLHASLHPQACSWSTFTPVVTVNVFQPIYPDVQYRKRTVITSEQQSFFWDSSDGLSGGWYSAASQPTPVRRSLAAVEQLAVAWSTITPEVISADKWQPVYPQPQFSHAKAYESVFVPVTVAPVPIDWFIQQPQPVFTKKPVLTESVLTPVAQVDTDWIQLQSQPVPVKRSVQLEATTGPVFIPEAVTVDKWFNQTSQPYSTRRTLPEAVESSDGQAPLGGVPDGTNPSVWIQQQQQPFPLKRSILTSDIPATFWNTSTQSETILADKWQPVYPQPLPVKYLLSSNQQSLFWSTFTPVPSLVPSQGGGTSSESLSFRINVSFASKYPSFFWSQFTPVTVVNVVPTNISQPVSRVQRRVFEAFFWNTSTQPEVVTEDRWHQSTNQPSILPKIFSVAQQVAFFWSEFTPVTVDQFLSAPPISQPQVARRILQSENVFIPVSVDATDWLLHQSQPLAKKKFIQSDSTTSPVFTTETVTVDKWFNQTSQPVTKVIRQFESTFTVVIPQDNVTADKWFSQSSQPYSTRRVQISESVFTTVEVVATDWFAQQSQPVSKIVRQFEFSFAPVAAPETVTVDKWFNQTSQPFPVKRTILTADIPSAFWNTSTQPETTSADKWQPVYPQPYPYRKNLATAEQQSSAWGNFTPPEVITVSSWSFKDLPQPDFTAKARRYQIALIASGMMPWQISTANEVVHADAWKQPETQSYPKRPYTPADYYPYHFWNTSTQAEVVHVDAWKQPESQPVYKRAYLASEQQAVFFTSISVETITVDKWFNQTSQPTVITKRPVSEVTNVTESVPTGWFVQADQPVSRKKAVTTEGISQPVTVSPIATDWLHQQSQPTQKVKRSLFDALTQPVTVAETVTADKWLSPTSQPVFKVKRQAIEGITGSFDLTTSDWQQPQSQPTAKKRPLIADSVIQSVTVVETVTVDKWYHLQSQPVYRKRLIVAAIPYVFWNTFTQETITADKFVQPTSQPYPSRKSLATADQQAVAWNTSTQQEVVTEDRWHPTCPQPYPAKRRVPAAYYPSFFWNTVVPETSNVEATLTIGVTQPYPYRKNLHTSNQQSSFWSGFTPAPETAWIPSYPDKVYGKKYLPTSDLPYAFWNTSTQGEHIFADKWQPVYPQPYPFKPALRTDYQLVTMWGTITPPLFYVTGTGNVTEAITGTGVVVEVIAGTGTVQSTISGTGKTG